MEGDFQDIGVRAVVQGFGPYMSQLGQMDQRHGMLSSGLGRLALALGAAAGGFLSFQAIKGAISSTQELASGINTLRRETGLSAEDSSRLAFVFKHVGLDAVDASRYVGIFAKKLKGVSDEETGVLKGGKSMAAILKDIGVEALDAHGNILPMSMILPQLADRFKKMPDGLEKTALAMELFGRGGKDMIKVLNLGSEGMAALGKTADKLGLTLSAKNLDAIKKYGLAQNDLSQAIGGLKLQIGLALIPVLTKVTLFLTSIQPALRKLLGGFLDLAHSGVGVLAEQLRKLRPALSFVKDGILSLVGVIRDHVIAAVQQAEAWFRAHLLPALQEVGGFIKENLLPPLEALGGTIKGFVAPNIDIFALSLGGALAAATTLGPAVSVLSDSFGALQGALSLIIMPPPLLLLLGVVAGLTAGAILVEQKTRFFSQDLLPALKDVAESIQTKVLPALEDLGKAKVIPVLEDFGKFLKEDFAPAVQASLGFLVKNKDETIAAVSGLIPPVLLLTAAIAGLGTAAAAADVALAPIAVAAGGISLPVTAVVVAIGLLVAGLVLLEEKTGFISKKVIPALEKFGKIELLPRLEKFITFLKEKALPDLKEWGIAIATVATAVGRFLAPALDTLHDLWVNLQPVIKALEPVLEAVGFALRAVGRGFFVLGRFMDEHKTLTVAVAAAILLLLNPWLAVVAVIAVVLAKWDEISQTFTKTIPDAISSLITKVEEIPILGEIFRGTFEAIKVIVETAFGFLMNNVQFGLDAISAIFDIFAGFFTGDWGRMWDGIKALFGTTWELIKADIKTAFEGVAGLVQTAMSTLGGVVGDIWDGVKTVFGTKWTEISTAITTAFGGVAGLVTTALSGVAGAVSGLGNAWATAIIDGFKLAWNAAAGVINSTIPNDISIPAIKDPFLGKTIFPGFDINLPDNPIPSLARGGFIPPGVVTPATLHGGPLGEAVIPLDRVPDVIFQPRLATILQHAYSSTSTFSASISVESEDRISAAIRRELRGLMFSSGFVR